MFSALVLVDIQNDFLPGGALAVPFGDEVIPIANALTPIFSLVIATQDWHPRDHSSFASNHPGKQPGDHIELAGLDQILWPDHCVQETRGAEFAAQLDLTRIERVFQKGTDSEIDSYSGFFDNHRRRATGLGEFLKDRNVTDLYLLGLATDYCVKATAFDAQLLGLKTYLILEGCRGVDLIRGDAERAIREMCAAGVVITPRQSVRGDIAV